MEKASKFNLQIPITKELENELRHLAELDDRKLRTYCRRVLELHVQANKQQNNIPVELLSPVSIKSKDNSTIEKSINLTNKKENTNKKINNAWKR